MLAVLLLAQELTGSVVAEMPIARTGGPVPITVILIWNGPGILRGALELDCTDIDTAECHIRKPGMALAGGTQTYRVLLPPMTAWNSRSPAILKVRFVPDAGDPIPIGEYPLQLPGQDYRSLAIGVTRPDAAFVPQINLTLADRLSLDRFDPDREGKNPLIRCTQAHVVVQGFAAAPLSLCAYDLLVMAHEGFAETSEAQLDVVARWVEGGGSVCVVPGPRAIFKPHHVAFLNRLGGRFRLDAAGAFEGDSAHLSPGIGRAVVANDAADADWTKAVIHLWKVRAEQAEWIRQTGAWSREMEAERLSRYYYGYEEERAIDYQPEPLWIEDGTIEKLLPQDLDTFSPWTILLILLGFVAVVGPGEWLMLGWLRARRFTWITFPVASVGLTAFLIVMANVGLGRGDERRTVTVVDVDADGRVLRWNRFEMIFAGFRRTDEREFTQALFVPMDYTRFQEYRYNWYRRDEPDAVEAVTMEGDLPHRAVVRQEIAQWAPQLNRITSFETLDGIREPPGADVFEFRGAAMRGQGRILPQAFVRQLCERPQRGLFSVVSQVSPKPDADFEDLSLHDPTDENAVLRVAVYQEGDDIVLIRSR